jgi:hypothetical protein
LLLLSVLLVVQARPLLSLPLSLSALFLHSSPASRATTNWGTSATWSETIILCNKRKGSPTIRHTKPFCVFGAMSTMFAFLVFFHVVAFLSLKGWFSQ